jgi:hypothetical protein
MKDYEVGFLSFLLAVATVAGLFALQGCAKKRDSLVITKPPMQLSFQGNVDRKTAVDLIYLMHNASKIPHQDYQFNENTNISFNISDAKTTDVSESTNNTESVSNTP